MRNTLYKFFDKTGSSLNLLETLYSTNSLQNIPPKEYHSLYGSVYMPKISTGLIESNNIFLLQEVIKDTSTFRLKSVSGTVHMNSGDSRLYGTYTSFETALQVGMTVTIRNTDFIVTSIQSDTEATLNNVPGAPFSDQRVYIKDYYYYTTPVQTDDCDYLECVFETEEEEFFLYSIDYSDNVTPWINKAKTLDISLSSETIGVFPGYDKPLLSNASSNPLGINIGFSSLSEGVFENALFVNKVKSYNFTLEAEPSLNEGNYYLVFTGNTLFNQISSESTITLISSNKTIKLDVLDCRFSGGYSVLVVKNSIDIKNSISSFNYTSFSLFLKNTQRLATINLYAEAESEDERFATTLANFGKKIDIEDEMIFRDSDINEALSNYTILNKKRKELLLEGDSIYPYIGSYKALINALNFFGYDDISIKEYFLNVDVNDTNFGKYYQVQIPKNASERALLKNVSENVPSTTHKKTSTFGLFYDLNKVSGEFDEEGIPIVIDAFDFTQEEVLIKLFGLKKVLQEKFLPLNSKITDITGEGIYFVPVKVGIWSDSLQSFEINVGKSFDASVFPANESYISDVRVIDDYYKTRFLQQGLKGFIDTSYLGDLLGDSSIKAEEIIVNNLGQYIGTTLNSFDQTNNNFSFFPESITNKNYNESLKLSRRLVDDSNVLTGAPVLLEAKMELSFDECDFSWDDIAQQGKNINIWSWDNISYGYNVEVQFKVVYLGTRRFIYDSGRNSIEKHIVDYSIGDQSYKRILDAVLLPYDGTYEVSIIFYDLHNSTSINTQTYKVNKREIEITSIYKEPAPNLAFDDLTENWDSYDSMSYANNLNSTTKWEDANCAWDDLSSADVRTQELLYNKVKGSILSINRELGYIEFVDDVSLRDLKYLTFKRLERDFILVDEFVAYNEITRINSTTFTINSSLNISLGSRAIFTFKREHGDFTYLNSSAYYYGDFIPSVNNLPTFSMPDFLADEFENFLQASTDFYITTGLFSGSYSVKIKRTDVNGNILTMTFDDANKELYLIDGNFEVESNNYDTDYALINTNYILSKEIINVSDPYEDNILDYNDLHPHGTIYNGFLIPFITPNGSIKINESDPFIFSSNSALLNTKPGLELAVEELKASKNPDISKWNYSVIPSSPLILEGDIGNIGVTINFATGVGMLSGTPKNLKIPAKVKPILVADNDGTFSIADLQIENAGFGYIEVPKIKITDPVSGENFFTFDVQVINGALAFFNKLQGTKYTENTIIEIEPPKDWFEGSNTLFIDGNWVTIEEVNYSTEIRVKPDPFGQNTFRYSAINYVPYKWHTQQFLNPEILNEFYFAIQATSKTSNQEVASYIRTDNGVYGEWKQNKFISNSLSLNNDLIYNRFNIESSLNETFDRMKFNNFTYPFKDVDPIYTEEILSKQSSEDSSYLFQDLLTFENTIVSNKSSVVGRNTGVIFSYKGSFIPGKNSPVWSIYRDGDLICQTITTNLFWNFDKVGEYSISLFLKDSNGNEYSELKNSFIKVL